MPIHWGALLTPFRAPRLVASLIERLLDYYAVDKNIKLFAPVPGEPTEVKPFISDWWKKYL